MPYITSEAAGQITFPNKIQAMLRNGVTIRSYERACHFYVSKPNGAIMAKTMEPLLQNLTGRLTRQVIPGMSSQQGEILPGWTISQSQAKKMSSCPNLKYSFCLRWHKNIYPLRGGKGARRERDSGTDQTLRSIFQYRGMEIYTSAFNGSGRSTSINRTIGAA